MARSLDVELGDRHRASDVQPHRSLNCPYLHAVSSGAEMYGVYILKVCEFREGSQKRLIRRSKHHPPLYRRQRRSFFFSQVKDKEEKTLSYVQYVSALNIIAATLFPEVRKYARWRQANPLECSRQLESARCPHFGYASRHAHATKCGTADRFKLLLCGPVPSISRAQLKRFRDFHAFKPKAARLLELVDGKILNADSATEYRQFAKKAGERYARDVSGRGEMSCFTLSSSYREDFILHAGESGPKISSAQSADHLSLSLSF